MPRSIALLVLLAMTLILPAASAPAVDRPTVTDAPRFVSNNLRSNRRNAMPKGSIQIVSYYDGATTTRPLVKIECAHTTTGAQSWIVLELIDISTYVEGARINTYDYDLGPFLPTGRFEVSGVTPNGVIDGLAFGMLWRDQAGRYTLLKSVAPTTSTRAQFVGAWPIGYSDDAYERFMPQVTTPRGREQARTIISGAEYLSNGTYLMAIQERSVRVD